MLKRAIVLTGFFPLKLMNLLHTCPMLQELSQFRVKILDFGIIHFLLEGLLYKRWGQLFQLYHRKLWGKAWKADYRPCLKFHKYHKCAANQKFQMASFFLKAPGPSYFKNMKSSEIGTSRKSHKQWIFQGEGSDHSYASPWASHSVSFCFPWRKIYVVQSEAVSLTK